MWLVLSSVTLVVLPGNSPTYSHCPICGVHMPHISILKATQVPTPHLIAQVEQPVRATVTLMISV
jgi:hypothetical protein